MEKQIVKLKHYSDRGLINEKWTGTYIVEEFAV